MILRVFRTLCSLFAAYLLAVAVLTLVFRVVPPVSAVMMASALRGDGMARDWVPLNRMSPNLIRAVLVSEDSRFCTHAGIDWHSVDKAVGEAGRRKKGPRGASTITMQVAKNLFLWNGRSWVRKAIEAPLALWIDLVWPKRRILEVYLNIAQWGDGVFGIEAAARRAYGTSARYITPQQAAQLAVVLPDPESRNAGRPGPGQIMMSAYLQSRLAREGANTSCLR